MHATPWMKFANIMLRKKQTQKRSARVKDSFFYAISRIGTPTEAKSTVVVIRG